MSDLVRTTPVTRQSTQPRDGSGESLSDRELVWPPPDSELDSYVAPLVEPGQTGAQTPVSDSIAARQTDAGQSTEFEAIREASPDASPDASPVATPEDQTGASDVQSHEDAVVPVAPVAVLARTEPEVTPVTPTAMPLLLSHVLHSNVAFHWHEAVAIVRQLGDQLTHGLRLEPQGSLPGVDGIELEPTGRLRARLDPAGAIPVVRGLGYLLHVLLIDTDAPVRLRLIVSQAVSEVPTFPSVERLTEELAGFERPRRLETLQQLYERSAAVWRARLLVAAAPRPDIHVASRPVSSRTVGRATEEARQRTVRQPRMSWPALVLALAVGAVCGALLFAAITARSAGREGAPALQAVAESVARDFKNKGVPGASQKRAAAAPADPVRPAAHGDLSPTRARGRPQNEDSVRPAMKPPAVTYGIAPSGIGELARVGPAGGPRSSVREVPQRAQREYHRARALFDQKDYAKATDGFLQVVKLLDDGELIGPAAELRSLASDYAALSRATLSAITGGPVYSSADEGVTEPVALRLYLPAPAPETPPSRLGVLMLVVNGEGAVESVRLQSPSNRYHDRFWVSAAKTWRFKPALKDGQPVKYLKRIVITEPPLSDPQ
jgi:hypothetical protein